jgi:4-amino-4-deoxy-L-arabinose transferase-like glycosyltransferase
MFKNLAIVVLAISVLLFFRIWNFGAEGVTYDEPIYLEAGREYFKALGAGKFEQEFWDLNKEHPPMTKYVLGFADWVGRDAFGLGEKVKDKYVPVRVMSVLLSLGSILGAYMLARFYLSKPQALLASLIVGLMPIFIGYSRLSGHEMVVTFFVVWCWYFYLRYKIKNRSSAWWLMNLFAILAFASRFNAVLAIFPIWLWEFFMLFKKNNPKTFLTEISKLVFLPVSMWVGIYLIWPYWWTDTWNSIHKTLGHWGGDPKELFLGQVQTAPIWYYLVYFWAQTPTLILMLGAIGLIYILVKIYRNQDKEFRGKYIFLLGMFLCWFLWSFASIKQGGLRYILPVYIPFGILSVIGVDLVMKRFKLIGVQKGLVYVLLIGYLVGINVQTQFWYLDYYNVLVGGSKQVYENKMFSLGFWGQGTLEAVQKISGMAGQGEKIGFWVYLMPEHLLVEYLDKEKNQTGIYKNDLEGIKKADWILVNSSMYLLENQSDIFKNYILVETIEGPQRVSMFEIYKKIVNNCLNNMILDKIFSFLKDIKIWQFGLLCSVIVAVFLFNLAWIDSYTADESVHTATGYSYVRYGDFRSNSEHPPIIKILAGMSLYLVG